MPAGPLPRARRLAAALLCVAAGAAAAAEPLRVEIALAAPGEPYSTFASRFEARWRAAEGAEPSAFRVTAGEQAAAPAADLVVTVGVAALVRELDANRQVPVYAALVPRLTFERLTAGRAPTAAPVAALWLDPPEARLMRLARFVAPQATRLGILLGPHSAAHRDALRAAATTVGVEIAFDAPDESNADPAQALARLLRRSDLLLALPDPTVWNRVTVETLLLHSFRARKPVVGVSPSLVRSGAVAAVYSTPEQAGEELADRLRAHRRLPAPRAALPASSHPAVFTVGTNPKVARELGLELETPAALVERLRAAERAR